MSEDATSLILRLLRDIRAKLDAHDGRFDSHDAQFVKLNKKIDDWQETTATALGLASHANIRNTAIETQIADLMRRVEQLEQAR